MSVARLEEVGYGDGDTIHDFKLMEPPRFERVHFGGEDGIRVQSGVCRFSSTSHHARVKSLATAVQPHLPEMRDDFAVRKYTGSSCRPFRDSGDVRPWKRTVRHPSADHGSHSRGSGCGITGEKISGASCSAHSGPGAVSDRAERPIAGDHRCPSRLEQLARRVGGRCHQHTPVQAWHSLHIRLSLALHVSRLRRVAAFVRLRVCGRVSCTRLGHEHVVRRLRHTLLPAAIAPCIRACMHACRYRW